MRAYSYEWNCAPRITVRCALVAAVQVTCVTIPNPERSIENAPSETKAIEFVRVLRMRRMEEKLREAVQIKKRPNLGTFPKGGGVSAKIKKFPISNSEHF